MEAHGTKSFIKEKSSYSQRVLNDLERTKILCGVILSRFLLTHPNIPLSCQQVVSLSQSYCVSPVSLLRGGKGVGGRGIRPQESLTLYISFNTLWFIATLVITFSRQDMQKRPQWKNCSVKYFNKFLLYVDKNLPMQNHFRHFYSLTRPKLELVLIFFLCAIVVYSTYRQL